ncbi:MAG: DUF3267 domain-containing protein [Thermoanaerobacteraceae bacterium]|nr:DUF3267 domain-containing protein [Thermoanaerobacteraceae bacterium]
MSFKVSWKVHMLCFLISFVFCFLTQKYLNILFINILSKNKMLNITGNIFLNLYIFILIIFIPLTFLHEALHGAAYKIFGGKVKYGFKGLYAYAQETSGIALSRTEFLIVLLAPVTCISVISMLIPGSIGGMVFFLNLLSSMGDLLMTFYLCKTHENSHIIDKHYGFDVIEN